MADIKEGILTKLREINERYEQIDQLISDPEIATDSTRLVKLTKEQGKMRDMVERYRRYVKVAQQLDDSEAMMNDSELDAEMRELAREEYNDLAGREQELFDNIKESMVMAEDSAIDSIIVEIRPGTGGDEASLFAKDLSAMYTRYAEKRGWKVETMSLSTTEMGGFREVILNIKGPGVWAELGYEGGGHRVQRVPETESQGRVHTSAATVAVLPEPEELDVDINPDDVLEHVSRAGGPGGQNVNKVSSAIKLEHVPTGITVSMRDEKSQHKNRAKAWRILRSRIYEHYQGQIDRQRESERKSMIGSGDRSQRIRTYNYPQNRLTDHRINVSLYSLEKVMMGEMDELIAALKDYDKQQRLEALAESIS